MVTTFACTVMMVKFESRSVVIVLRSQVWIFRIQENDLSVPVLLIGKTAIIFRGSLTFGKKMLSACFANSQLNSKEIEMDL